MAQWVVVSEGERLHPPPDGLQVVLYTARTGSTTPAKGDTLSLYTVPSGGGNAPQVLDEGDWTSSIDGTGVVVFTSTPVYWTFSVSRTYQGILLLTSTNQIYRAAEFTSAWVVSPGDQKGVQLTDYRYDVSDIGQVSQTITVTETGSTFEQVMIAVSVAVTETGAGAETLSMAAVLALTESGAGAEEVSYAGDGEVSVTDTGGEASSTVTVSASIPITDSGTDSETLLHSPDSPTITSVTPGDGSNSIDLGTSAGATSYNLYWVDGTDNPTWDTTAEILANGTKITGASDPHSHTSLTNGHEYRYVQTAVNAAGESGGSEVVTGTPAAAGTVYDFEADDEGFTFSRTGSGSVNFARSATSPIAGTYSLRVADSVASESTRSATKTTVAINNGQTVSAKVLNTLASAGDDDGSISTSLWVNGSNRAATGVEDATQTISWVSNLPSSTYTIELRTSIAPNNSEGEPLSTAFTSTLDDVSVQ